MIEERFTPFNTNAANSKQGRAIEEAKREKLEEEMQKLEAERINNGDAIQMTASMMMQSAAEGDDSSQMEQAPTSAAVHGQNDASNNHADIVDRLHQIPPIPEAKNVEAPSTK